MEGLSRAVRLFKELIEPIGKARKMVLEVHSAWLELG
jgi:hypothetical protein